MMIQRTLDAVYERENVVTFKPFALDADENKTQVGFRIDKK
jgi:hypothetical protein